MISKEVFFCILFVAIGSTSHGQLSQEPEPDSTRSVVDSRYLKAVGEKAGQLEKKLRAQNARTLKRLERQELRMQKKLAKIDSVKAIAIFGNVRDKYARARNNSGKTRLSQYIGSIDTIETSLKFLQHNPSFLEATSASNHKIGHTFEKLHRMKKELQGAEDVKKFIKERQQYLKDQLSKFGLAKELKKLSKLSYYSTERLNAYKDLLKDNKKAERKALELLFNSKTFQQFLAKNSQLAQLFSIPANYSSSQSLAGLQTRAQVQQAVGRQIGTAPINGTDPRQYVQGQMQNAQQQLNKLKDKVHSLGLKGSGGDLVMPDFKPKKLKTRTFFQRLEYGFDLQNQAATRLLPVTSDFSVSVGYKLTEGATIGVGTSFKMGWGTSLRNLEITNQGAGLRSYLDVKAKGNFWISGGMEYNYQREFRNLFDLPDPDIWQKSALLGVSKKYRIAKNKQGIVQLLFDFLAREQMPRAQALKFRIGYRF